MEFANLSSEAGFSRSRRTSTSSCSTIYKPSHVYRTLSAFYNPSPLETRPVAQKKEKARSPKRTDSVTPRRFLGRSPRPSNKSASSLFSKFFARSQSYSTAELASAGPVRAAPAPKLETKNLSTGGPKSAPPVPTGHNSVLNLDEYHQQQRELCGSPPLPALPTPELPVPGPEPVEFFADSPTDAASRTRSTSNSSSMPRSPAETALTELSLVDLASAALPPAKAFDEAWDTTPTPTPAESSNSAEPPRHSQPLAAAAPSPPPTMPLPPSPAPRKAKLAPQIQRPEPRATATELGPVFGTFTTCAAVPPLPMPPRSASASAAAPSADRPSARTAAAPPRLLTPQPRRKTLRLFPQPPPPADLPILPYKRLSMAPDPSSATPQLRPQTASRRAGSVSSGAPSPASDASRSTSVASASSGGVPGPQRRGHAANGSSSAASATGAPSSPATARPAPPAAKDPGRKLREWELATFALRYEDTAKCGEPFRTKAAAQLRSGKRW